MKKTIYLCLYIVLLSLLISCGKDNTVSYAELPENEQAAIDFVLSKGDAWDNGNCENAYFTTHDDQPAFFVSMLVTRKSDVKVMRRTWYSYDVEANVFEEIDSSSIGINISSTANYGTLVEPSKNWDSTWSEEKNKDYLASKLHPSD